MDRIELLKNHLSTKGDTHLDTEDPKKYLQKYRSKSTICPVELKKIVYGKYEPIRQRVFETLLKDPTFRPYTATESTRKEVREMTLRWMKAFNSRFGTLKLEEYEKDPSVLHYLTNAMYECESSFAVKFAAHYCLYTKTIINLGTEKHRPHIERACSMEDIGCFGLTELGHGSNAKGVQTRADFDPKTREFVINTPVDIAMKFWIGAAAHLANMSVVLAQLYIGDKNYGVHAFIVPIRNKKDHTLIPGVIVGDCGLKVGINAVDNGFLMFKDVRVPYDNLLDKFSSITPEGKFKSPIKSADKRFGLSLGCLSGGRIQFIDGANNLLRNALTIAVRFTACRRQFGPPGQAEVSILEYPLTQYRIIPYLADSLVIGVANSPIVDVWCSNQDKIFKENNPLLSELHSLSSALKPIASWVAVKGIQEAREACGGLGFSAYSRLGQLREENDINTTWEGDNHVLLQQTAKFLMDSLRNLKGGNKLPFPSLSFLQEEFNSSQYSGVVDGKSQFCRDGYNLRKAFEVRANYLIHASFEHLQKNIMSSDDTWKAWNNSHVFFLKEASIAYGETYLLTEFEKRLETVAHENTKKVLGKISEVYAYTRLERYVGTFFEIGYFTKDDLTYIRQKITDLCLELKDEIVGLIDVIAVPDELLNSPIGASDGDIYNRFISAVWTAPGAFERPGYWRLIRGDGN